ncbi:MAG: hypothetical protein GY862_31730 [Gammaproteobacteria bacterium]|nr:hypothetical protein [Gammaproteobacteria bacterium]
MNSSEGEFCYACEELRTVLPRELFEKLDVKTIAELSVEMYKSRLYYDAITSLSESVEKLACTIENKNRSILN